MVNIVTITSQGQVTIPSKLRRSLGLKKRGKAMVSSEEGKIIIEPVKDLLDLKGSLKTNKKPLSSRQLDEVIAAAVVEEYKSKLKRTK